LQGMQNMPWNAATQVDTTAKVGIIGVVLFKILKRRELAEKKAVEHGLQQEALGTNKIMRGGFSLSSLRQGHRDIKKLRKLLGVKAAEAGSGSGARAPPGILNRTRCLLPLGSEARPEAWLHKGVGAHVERLLLAPHQLRVGEAPDFSHDKVVGERVELLDAHERNLILKVAFLALLE